MANLSLLPAITVSSVAIPQLRAGGLGPVIGVIDPERTLPRDGRVIACRRYWNACDQATALMKILCAH